MKYFHWKILPAALIIFALSFNFTPTAPGAVGDIVNWYYGHAPSHYGGVTIKKANDITYICENENATGTIYIMVPDPLTPNTLTVTETIGLGIAKDAGIAWDPEHDCWWMSGANWYYGIGQLPANGGSFIRSWIPPYVNPYGVFYHSASEQLYVGTSYNTAYIVYNMSQLDTGGEPVLVDRVDTGLGTPECLARAGDTMWCGIDYGIYKYDLNGNYQGIHFYLPDSGRGPVDLDFDGQYLWARSNKVDGSVKIYQIDVGYNPPPSPTPSPAPTPAILVIDSGDYNGDGTSDYAVFRGSEGLWAVRGVTAFYYGTAGDIPVSGDYNGDGTTEAGIYRPSSGLWSIRNVTRVYFGSADDIPVPGDYTGSKRCNIGIFNSSSGLWAIRHVTRTYFGSAGDLPVPGYYDKANPGIKLIATFRPANALWASPGFTRTYFGQAGDSPVPGQYDQDDDNWEIGIFRPQTSLWSILDGRRFYFGSSEDWPVPADYQGDHFTDSAVFRSSSGLWSVQGVTRLYYGADGDVPVTGRVPRHLGPTPSPPPPVLDSADYDGDGTSDLAVFRPSLGLWAIKDLTHLYFGRTGDIPVSGDYDGDGSTDIAFYRPSLGLWSVRGLTRAYYGGGAGDIPVPGDYNGSGRCNMGVFRPKTGLWSIRHLTRLYFGGAGDLPVPDYYRGERAKEIAVFRPSTGLWSVRDYTRVYYGRSGDIPKPADVTGTGRTNLVLFRPSNALWLIHNVGTSYFGSPGDLPVPADYLGDGTSAIGVFRDTAGLWAVNGVTRAYFGQSGDVPLPGRLPNPPEPPTVVTEFIYNVTSTTAEVVGEVTGEGSGPVTARGVCWSTAANPTVSDSKTVDGSGTGAYLSDITGLSPGTLYHVRAYATNGAGAGYGADETFTTLLGSP